MKNQAAKIPEAKTEAELKEVAQRDEMFGALTRDLNTELGKAISDKTAIETRMLADEAQY
jgi:hypothetical protein